MDYEKSMTYLIGQVMKLTKGRSDPKLVRKIFEEYINIEYRKANSAAGTLKRLGWPLPSEEEQNTNLIRNLNNLIK